MPSHNQTPPAPAPEVRRLRRLAALGMLCAFGAAALPMPAPAQGLRLAAEQVEAGLIYAFLRYTDWSPDTPAGAPLVVCIYGRDSLHDSLTAITAHSVDDHAIALRVVDDGDAFANCSLLFVGAQQHAPWPLLRTALSGRRVLTVSDSRGFADSGGMIEFVQSNGRIGIRVNGAAIAQSGLVVHDRLLRLADSSAGGARP